MCNPCGEIVHDPPCIFFTSPEQEIADLIRRQGVDMAVVMAEYARKGGAAGEGEAGGGEAR
jgi:hypothetical protein